MDWIRAILSDFWFPILCVVLIGVLGYLEGPDAASGIMTRYPCPC